MADTRKKWAMIIGVILLLVGLWGFFQAPMLNIFGVNPLHNIVHLVTGAIFLRAGLAKGKEVARLTNQWLGVIYIIVGLVGFLGVLQFLNVNMADNWLHLLLGVISAGIGWGAKK